MPSASASLTLRPDLYSTVRQALGLRRKAPSGRCLQPRDRNASRRPVNRSVSHMKT